MSSAQLLPVVQHWDCHNCAVCCVGTIVTLDEEDRERLRQQDWEAHPEYRGVKTVVRQGLFSRQYQLAWRRDGRCVFLLPDGLCRIHRDYGFAAKPKLCRVFPFQTVAQEGQARVLVRRSCPSAAAGKGRPVERGRDDLEEALRVRPPPKALAAPPEIVRGHRRSWKDTNRLTDAWERLLCDATYPLVRRVAHASCFCEMVAQCRPARLDGPQFAELLQMLEPSAVEEAATWFRRRRPPDRSTSMLLRRVLLEYARLHPKTQLGKSWATRWRLVRLAWAFGRGRGAIPSLGPELPPVPAEALDRALGPLPEEVLQPLVSYVETMAASRGYALAGRRGWPLVDSLRALVVAHPVAMWLARLAAPHAAPRPEHMIDAVIALDRGDRYAGLTSWQHRKRLALIGGLGGFARVITWYGR